MAQPLRRSKSSTKRICLQSISLPTPVFYCSIEPESLSGQKALDEALHLLQREDPSFSISQDAETGQTLISAMGELHLEILRHRILDHYRAPARIGPVRISYRSTVSTSLSRTLSRQYDISGNKQDVSVTVEVSPAERGQGNLFDECVDEEVFQRCNRHATSNSFSS